MKRLENAMEFAQGLELTGLPQFHTGKVYDVNYRQRQGNLPISERMASYMLFSFFYFVVILNAFGFIALTDLLSTRETPCQGK